MATLSVLNYNIPNGLNMKLNQQNLNSNSASGGSSINKTFNKITVQNVLSENSRNSLNISNGNPNAIVRKIKDFGMIGAVNNATGAASLNINPRKRPLEERKPNLKVAENKLTVSANKKPKLTKEERAAIRAAKKAAKENNSSTNVQTKQPLALFQQTKVPGTPGRKGLPLPQAVARRNARERNRVKQVNNGFAALRERIPEEVAEVFENQGPKGSGKKLSKVETLRMAVEYIRSLEKLLGFDFPIGGGHHTSSSGEESFSLIKDEFDAYSPSMDEQFDDSLSHYDTEEFFNGNTNNQTLQIPPPLSPPLMPQMEMLPNITTLNGLQYIRIPGTNTYQLLTPDIFVGTAASPPSSTIDEEHFNALIDTNCVSPTSASSSPIQQANVNSNAAGQQRCTPPSSINSSELIRRVHETAPVLATQHITNGEPMNEGSTTLLSSISSSSSSSALLLSPVPQNQQQRQILTITSPSSSVSNNKSPVLHQQQQQQQQQRTLSPASANDHHQQQQQHQLQQAGLRQTCAANQQRPEFLLPNSSGQQIGTTIHMIKQEFEEPSVTYQKQTSPLPIQLQQQQQQHQHQQQPQQLYQPVTSLAMSPPLDRNTPTTSMSTSSQSVLQNFYTHEQQSSYYEGVLNLKKEFNDVLLDASNGANVLSDESMIEAIDWWDAHTPKSDGGAVML